MDQRIRVEFRNCELESRLAPSVSTLFDIVPGPGSSSPSSLTNVSGTLFFTANDGVHGAELWKIDGTATGATLVRDIFPGAGSSNPSHLTNVNGRLFFAANDGVSGTELWASDGTSAGIVLVRDIYPGSAGSDPQYLTNVNNTLFFGAAGNSSGGGLWRSDGTSSGTTVIVSSISMGYDSSSNPAQTNGILIFGSMNNFPYRSDGTVFGTYSLVSGGGTFGSPFEPDLYTQAGPFVFFNAYFSTNRALFRTDGTTGGTISLGATNPINMTNVNGTLYFAAKSPSSSAAGYELFASNGNNAGMVRDINPGTGNSSPHGLTNAVGTLFFSANDGSGNGLWKSNGTSAGTTLLRGSFDAQDITRAC